MHISTIGAEMVVHIIALDRRTIVPARGSTLGATARVIMIICEVTFNDTYFHVPYRIRI